MSSPPASGVINPKPFESVGRGARDWSCQSEHGRLLTDGPAGRRRRRGTGEHYRSTSARPLSECLAECQDLQHLIRAARGSRRASVRLRHFRAADRCQPRDLRRDRPRGRPLAASARAGRADHHGHPSHCAPRGRRAPRARYARGAGLPRVGLPPRPYRASCRPPSRSVARGSSTEGGRAARDEQSRAAAARLVL